MPTESLSVSAVLAALEAFAFTACALAASVLPALPAPAQDTPPRPNVVVILVDDMGFSDLSCYGGEIPTPNLDALAANGVRFTQFYNTGRCCPTRASLLTGLYAHQAGVGHMTADRGVPGYRGALNDRCVTLGDVARSAGYRTIATGKWHVGSRERSMWPHARGFDRFYGVPEGGGFYFQVKKDRTIVRDDAVIHSVDRPLPDGWYSTDAWTEEGLRSVDDALEAGLPFFWYLAHNAPHFPLQASAADIARFRGKYRAGWDRLARERYRRQVATGLIDGDWEPAPRPDRVAAWESLSDEQKDRFDHIMAVYAACVWRMDRSIGTLVDGLRERGVLDDTLSLFLSDNGGNAEAGPKGRTNGDPTLAGSSWYCGKSWAWLQNTPFELFKHFNHEGGIATPLIAHWPAGIGATARGTWCREPGHVIDVMATLVDLTGATHPARVAGREPDRSPDGDHDGDRDRDRDGDRDRDRGREILPMEGTSLLPAFRGEPLARRDLFWEHEGNAAVRRGDWKLVRQGAGGAWQLYDLAGDRTEQHDLAAAKPELAAELRDLWLAWAERCHVDSNGPPKKKR